MDLVPAATDVLPCAEHTRAISVRPRGTGLRLDRVVVVETPLPWPKPALSHPLLKPLVAGVTRSVVPSRLFASEPGDGMSSTALEVWERQGAGALHARVEVAPGGDVALRLAQLIERVSDAPLGGLAAALDVDVATASSVLLVCTQGSHDACCGTEGRALADALSERGVALRRVSHTGGHRFAPTFMHLPTGRMWAHSDLELALRVAGEDATIEDLAEHARGWWGCGVGAPQAAEIAARVQLGSMSAGAAVVSATDDDRVSVTVGRQRVDLRVTAGREVPTISCGVPGGLPIKKSAEWNTEVLAVSQAD